MPRARGRVTPRRRHEHPTLHRIYQVSPWTNQAALCRGLEASTPGVDREHSTLQRWLAAGKGVPPDWLLHIAYLCDVRYEWLLTGEGEVYRGPRTVESYGPGAALALALWRQLSPQARSLWLRLGTLMDTWGSYLGQQADLLESVAGVQGWHLAASPQAEADELHLPPVDDHGD